MLRELLRRPSIVVAAWILAVLSLFAWRGDLRLERTESASAGANAKREAPTPVVVRRTEVSPPAVRDVQARSGRVLDSLGFLLVGAEVVAEGAATQRTGADGAFLLGLPQARVSDVLVRAEGRRSRWMKLSAVGPDPLVVVLEAGAPWDATTPAPEPASSLRGEGTVVGPDGEPLAFAFVNVLGTDVWARTDDIGRVELPLPSAAATFVVHRPGSGPGNAGFAALSAPFVAPRERGVVPLPELVGAPGGSIRGVVRDARGAPIAGVPVQVVGAGCRRVAESGPGGAFMLDGLAPAEYEVAPVAWRGAVGESVTVDVDREVVACDVRLRRFEEASLRVVDEAGAAAAGVWIASGLRGVRRAVAQANDEGVVSLPFASDSEFEVCDAGSFARREVRGFDSESTPATLVIAQP